MDSEVGVLMTQRYDSDITRRQLISCGDAIDPGDDPVQALGSRTKRGQMSTDGQHEGAGGRGLRSTIQRLVDEAGGWEPAFVALVAAWDEAARAAGGDAAVTSTRTTPPESAPCSPPASPHA